jgi:hypothetical protein
MIVLCLQWKGFKKALDDGEGGTPMKESQLAEIFSKRIMKWIHNSKGEWTNRMRQTMEALNEVIFIAV